MMMKGPRDAAAAVVGSLTLLMLLMLLILVGSSAGLRHRASYVILAEAARSAGCEAESPRAEGSEYDFGLRTGQSSRHSMMHNGVRRYWNVHLPASYDHTKTYPLILSFHGWGSDKVRPPALARARPGRTGLTPRPAPPTPTDRRRTSTSPASAR